MVEGEVTGGGGKEACHGLGRPQALHLVQALLAPQFLGSDSFLPGNRSGLSDIGP